MQEGTKYVVRNAAQFVRNIDVPNCRIAHYTLFKNCIIYSIRTYNNTITATHDHNIKPPFEMSISQTL